jgi:hypothetical protein
MGIHDFLTVLSLALVCVIVDSLTLEELAQGGVSVHDGVTEACFGRYKQPYLNAEP